MKIEELSLKELASALNNKEISSVEVTKSYLEKIEKHNKEINAFITITNDSALKAAQASDNRRKEGSTLGVLDGIPIAIKDNFLTKGIKTTNASKFYENFVPPYESTVTQNLLDSGMVFLGKTNLDEFAMGSSTMTSHFGSTINPYKGLDNKNKTPGGSSGGSSAAIASNMAPAAIGSDTGGSIRQPSSFCGVVGMKPSYGTCSRFGIFAFASSLDQAGPLTKTVEDNAVLLNAMASYDSKDSTMVAFPKIDYTKGIGEGIKKVKIGVPREYLDYKLDDDVKEAYLNTIKILEKEGAEIVDINIKYAKYSLAVYYVIAPVEAASNFARYDGIRYGARSKDSKSLVDAYKNSRNEGWGEEVKTRILIGSYNLSKEHFEKYINATKIRRLITQELKDIFTKVDFILTPTTASASFNYDDISNNPLDMYYNDIFTINANLSGVPAISIPHSYTKNKMPIGVQLIGNYYKEADIYKVAYMLEKNFNFKPQAGY